MRWVLGITMLVMILILLFTMSFLVYTIGEEARSSTSLSKSDFTESKSSSGDNTSEESTETYFSSDKPPGHSSNTSSPDTKTTSDAPAAEEKITSTGPAATSSFKASSMRIRPLGTFKIVAYFKGGNGLLTATGVECQEGVTIAVDPAVIPYGTVVWVDGLGIRIAQDCGGFRGNVIDVYMKQEADCWAWGSQDREVYVIEEWEEDVDVR